MNENPSPIQRLAAARRSLRRRALAAVCLQTLGLAAAGILLLDGINRFLPFREGTAWTGIAAVLVVAVLLFLFSCLRLLLRFPGVRDLALQIETCNPELMDSLICAVEIEEQPPEQRGVLARALLDKTAAETAARDFRRQVLPPGLSLGRFLFLAVVFSFLAGLALRSELLHKAIGYERDRRLGRDQGILVKPGNAEIPVSTDLTVTARVTRWQQEAWIQVRSAGVSRRDEMTRDREGRFEFTFFSVQEELRYRVVTPSLASPWFRVTPFIPPVLESCRLRVIPPAYTGQAPLDYHQPQDIKVLDGSLAAIEIQVAAEVTAEFVANRAPHRFTATAKTVRQLELTIRENLECLIRLRTPQGRTAETLPFKIECLPDLPPVVAVLNPIQDIQVPPETVVNTAVRAMDDFGLTAIAVCLAVSGGSRLTVPLFTAPPAAAGAAGEVKPPAPVRERQASANLNLASFKVTDGDVVSVFFTATDNRQPQPQDVRSSVFFIIIRSDKKDAAQGSAGEKKEIDLSGVIAELKRLIRLSWDVLAVPAPAQAAGRAELLSGLRDLRLEVQKKINEIAGFTGMEPGAEPITVALQEAVRELETAAKLADRELVEESIPSQERALARIVAAETELIKNAAAAGKGKGGKPKEKPEKPGEENAPDQGSKPGDAAGQANMVQELKDFLDRTRQLSRQQEELNGLLERIPVENPPPDVLPGAAGKEHDLETAARDLAVAMDRNPACQQPAREIRGAAEAMDRGARGLEKENVREGQRQGTRAGNLLQAAIQSLEALHRQAAAAEIQRLAKQTQQLAAEEKQEADATSQLSAQASVPDPVASQRKQAQAGLQQAAEKLQQETQAAAESLDEVYPEAARKLGEALAQAREKNLPGSFTRAANALLYQRFDKASQFQKDAAGILGQMADKLMEAAKELPALSREQLERILSDIQRGREAVRQAQQGPPDEANARLGELQPQFANSLDRLAELLQDQALRQLAESMSAPLDGNAETAGNSMLETLTAASRILEQYLMNSSEDKRPALRRKASAVPENYRRLIEQYFKNLSETGEGK